MFLFKKKKTAPQEPEPTFVISVPYSAHFKGFKRIQLDSYNDAEAEAGLQAAKAAASVDKIVFKEYRFPGVTPLIRVFADNYKLGTIWRSSHQEYYDLIKKKKCTKATFGYNELGNVFVFIKFE